MTFQLDQLYKIPQNPFLIHLTVQTMLNTIETTHNTRRVANQVFNFYLGFDARTVNSHFLTYLTMAERIIGPSHVPHRDMLHVHMDFARNVAYALKKRIQSTHGTRMVLKMMDTSNGPLYLLYLSVVPYLNRHEEVIDSKNDPLMPSHFRSNIYTKTEVLENGFTTWLAKPTPEK